MTRHAVPLFIQIFAALWVAACNERDWSDLFPEPALEGAPASAGVAGRGESESSLEGITIPPSNTGGAPGGTKDSNTAGVANTPAQESAGGSGDEPPVQAPSGASGGSAGEPESPSTTGSGGSSSGGVGAGGVAGAAGKGGEHAGSSENGGSAGDGAAAGAGGPGGSAGSSACSDGAREYCDGLDNDCDGEVDEHDACPSQCIGHAHDGVTGYMFCKEADFDDALERCKKSDMHLAWLESAEENDMLLSAAMHIGISGEGLWIGGSDREHEGEWMWVDSNGRGQIQFWSGDSARDGGKAVGARYTQWSENRPNDRTMSSAEDCLTFTLERSDVARGTWNDDGCEDKWPFVCEK